MENCLQRCRKLMIETGNDCHQLMNLDRLVRQGNKSNSNNDNEK
jgi:hypothetical protein